MSDRTTVNRSLRALVLGYGFIPDMHTDTASGLADVASACRSGGDPVASASVGRTALAIVEQAYASAGPRTRRAI